MSDNQLVAVGCGGVIGGALVVLGTWTLAGLGPALLVCGALLLVVAIVTASGIDA